MILSSTLLLILFLSISFANFPFYYFFFFIFFFLYKSIVFFFFLLLLNNSFIFFFFFFFFLFFFSFFFFFFFLNVFPFSTLSHTMCGTLQNSNSNYSISLDLSFVRFR